MRALASHAALVVVSVVFAGLGCGGSGADAPAASQWRELQELPAPRFEAYAASVSGKIVYLGGITGIQGDQTSARESDRVDVYDPVTDAWAVGPSLPPGAARHHLAVAVSHDRIYLLGGFTGIIGGADVAGRFLPNAQTWVLPSLGGAWQRLADQPLARGAASAQALGDRLYVAGGGSDENGAMSDVFAYDPAADRWSRVASMPTPREHLASCALGDRMLVVGGWAGELKTTVAAAESYDPKADVWTRYPDLPTQRGGLGAVALGADCYVVGGERWDRGLPGTFAVVERWDGANATWRSARPLPVARHGIGVTAASGSLFVVGGGPVMGNSYTDAVEVFTP